MEVIHIIGLLLVLVVAFFAYQWWSRRSQRPGKKPSQKVNRAAEEALQQTAGTGSNTTAPASEPERLPHVPGQTEEELTAKEPLQRRQPPPQQEGIGPDAQAPAEFRENLRHPEQLFHQPQEDTAIPTMTISDVPAGRSSVTSTPLSGNQQQFGPETAQNGSAFIGDSVFAFDGMEPSGFSSF